MELRQLKYFIKAAELQNFTEASNVLFITQSTLSQQIKQLEDELGIPLFDRIAKRVKLTYAGKTFLPYALKTVKDADDGKTMLKDLMNLNTGSLTIGVTYGLTNLLGKAILDFATLYPNVKLEISFGTTKELLEKLEQGALDLLLSFSQDTKNGMYTIAPLFSSSLALIVHAQHPISSRMRIKLMDLRTIPLLLPSGGFSIRNYLDAVLHEQRLQLDIKMEINDINTILQLVNSGRWATILMGSSIFNHPELKAIEIADKGMIRQATVTWLSGSYRKKSATLLFELLEEQVKVLLLKATSQKHQTM
ncbi:LysR substrate-binding domain-containing protein [Pedobacter sp. MC2016-14]|uniref:LysR substrate-binding domain-containing protein n=1 Tax=Pedobacter sp. MC2016-14 TaxID=2897327 RepID=UPI001E3BCAB3|nr:LysR substrate-binding domain-containing protein [Pedobacter sp. MC2016-14]MCD0488075.1 LysR substrate-binding domain-containing protein [Pedobacter sp. MC2016-14]